MALLWDMNVNAQRDERQDNRSWTSSNTSSMVYSPIFAFDSSVMGNSADASATSKTSSEKEAGTSGITGDNIQNVALIGGAALVAVGIAYVAGNVFKKK